MTGFEMTLVNLAGILGVMIFLVINLIKLGLIVFVVGLLLSVVEEIKYRYKYRNKKDNFKNKKER